MKRPTSTLFTILADVLLQLTVVWLALIAWVSQQLSVSEVTAAKVPGLHTEIRGLQGMLEEGRLDLRRAKERGARLHTLVVQRDARIGELSVAMDAIESENAELRSRFRSGAPVTVVVLIDVTGSMTDSIESLRAATINLFEILANVSKDFRFGVLAFRVDQNQGPINLEFPVTRILPRYEDDGRTQDAALKFLESLQAKPGYTNHELAFESAFAMLRRAHPSVDKERKERLVFLGDVGCSELDRKPGFSPAESNAATQIVGEVRAWARQGDRAVASLYANTNFARNDPTSAQSRAWFQALGEVSNSSEFYTETNSLLRAVLQASLD